MPSDIDRMKTVLSNHPGLEKVLPVREMLTIFRNLYTMDTEASCVSEAKDSAQAKMAQWLSEPPMKLEDGSEEWPKTLLDALRLVQAFREERVLLALAKAVSLQGE